MDIKTLSALFLVVTFVIHGIAFTILGLRRRKTYYFLLTGTFTFLTAIYFIKFEGWTTKVLGTDFSPEIILRVCAILCTLAYLRAIYNEKGSWLWKLTHRKRDQSLVN